MNILLVEDDPNIAAFIKKGLREASYQVEHAPDGEEGLFMAQTRDYDLIILDVMLPIMDGLRVCKEIRKTKPSIFIIMLTAKITVKDKVNGLEAGADDYLTKPFAFDELLARVRAALRRGGTQSTDLTLGELKIDILARRVFYGKDEIILRPKEYGVLQYMLTNKGRVLSRTQILENVWGYDYDPNTNVVDVYIRYLREKLNPFFNENIIRTIKGTGYMIEDLNR